MTTLVLAVATLAWSLRVTRRPGWSLLWAGWVAMATLHPLAALASGVVLWAACVAGNMLCP